LASVVALAGCRIHARSGSSIMALSTEAHWSTLTQAASSASCTVRGGGSAFGGGRRLSTRLGVATTLGFGLAVGAGTGVSLIDWYLAR
jgi:hypothetical protein